MLERPQSKRISVNSKKEEYEEDQPVKVIRSDLFSTSIWSRRIISSFRYDDKFEKIFTYMMIYGGYPLPAKITSPKVVNYDPTQQGDTEDDI